jgi:hypothetical protein
MFTLNFGTRTHFRNTEIRQYGPELSCRVLIYALQEVTFPLVFFVDIYTAMTDEQQALLRLYEQLAQTMEVLVEIQRLEGDIENVKQGENKNNEKDATQQVAKRRQFTGLFDDEDDIRRIDQVFKS